MTTQSPTLASQATAELPKLPRYSFSITKAEHGMNWKATPDPEGSLCLYAEVQAAFAASNPSQETAELPKLPAFPIIVGRPWDAQDAIDYAHAAMQAGYEAGRASRAQSETAEHWMHRAHEFQAERDDLRQLLDTRPALNAGLADTYRAWTGKVYAADVYRVAFAAGATPGEKQ